MEIGIQEEMKMEDRLKECIMEIGDNDGWYNLMKIVPYWDRTNIAFVVGGRGIGKTELAVRLSCLAWNKYHIQTVWCRMKKVELEDPQFYTNLMNFAKKQGWCDEDWEGTAMGVRTADGEYPILFQSLSTYGNKRSSGALPDACLMVLDEFIPEDRRYATNSATALLSLCKTLLRGKGKGKTFCLCLSNWVSASNPFFASYRIYPNRRQDVTWFDNKMLIEVCRGYREIQDDSDPWMVTFNKAGYKQYDTDVEDSLFGFVVDKMPKGCKDTGVLLKSQGNLYTVQTKEGLMYFALYKGNTNNKKVYTNEIKEQGSTVSMVPKYIRKVVMDAFENGGCRFVTPNALFAVLVMFYAEF